jgi:hypothetical protein
VGNVTPIRGAGLTAARQVADTVLYEGYLLYPYRATSAKNQVRWQFGVLGPQGAADAGVGEPPAIATDLALETQPGSDATIDIFLRFLHVQARTVEARTVTGWEPRDVLTTGGSDWIAFHEAAAQEVAFTALRVDELAAGQTLDVSVPAAQEIEELYEGDELTGRLIRTRWPLSATVTARVRPGQDPRLRVLTVSVANTTSWTAPSGTHENLGQAGWTARDLAARHSLVGTHLLLTTDGARFLSLLDGPDWAGPDIASFTQSRCWPGLIADDAGGDAVLISPIILGDHPAIAPESVGDLFDATEIDEILTLRVMTMTDAEKAEARGTDPRAAAIVERCEAMTDEALGMLHGGRRPVPPPEMARDMNSVPVYGELGDDSVPWWDEGRDARAEPTTDSILVNDVPVSRGSRVLLRPTRRADAQDLFLAGQTAVVTRVYFDVDGGTHVAVVLEDDPGSDLYDASGRFFYFGPEEIEPLAARSPAREARS